MSINKQKTLSCSECKGTNLVWKVYVNEFDVVQYDYKKIYGQAWCDACLDNVRVEEIEENELE